MGDGNGATLTKKDNKFILETKIVIIPLRWIRLALAGFQGTWKRSVISSPNLALQPDCAILESMGDAWRNALKQKIANVIWLLMKKCLKKIKDYTSESGLTTDRSVNMLFIPQIWVHFMESLQSHQSKSVWTASFDHKWSALSMIWGWKIL